MKKIFDAKIWQKHWKKISHHPVFIKTAIISGATIVALAAAIFIFNLTFAQTIFPKTYIGGINLGGKTLHEVQEILAEQIKQNQNQEITLAYDDQTWPLTASEIDLNYDAAKSAAAAWTVGRQGGLGKIIKEQFKAIFSTNRYSAVITFNQSKLDQFLSNLAKKIDQPEQDATVMIDNLEARIEPEKIGRRLNLSQNSHAILNLFGSLVFKSQHNLIVDKVEPKVTQTNAQTALAETQKILTGGLTLITTRKDFKLKGEELAPWLTFVNSHSTKAVLGETTTSTQTENLPEWVLTTQVSREKVRAYVEQIAAEINQEARDAKFAMQGGRAMAFQTSQTGYELDKEQAIKVITEAILNHQTEVKLPVKVTEPDVSSSAASGRGIKELVGEGVTSWRGSPKNRIHNLTLGSKNISGTIVKPDEEFSTVKAIGPIDAAHGFLPELVIKNGTEVVPDIGGGLCQVSTTLFRAALNAGFKITERTNHSFRVSYYEPPAGMDATIYDPAPDFKFINNMETPILIWATPTDNGLSFQIYGAKDGRKVEISDPVVFDYINPPDPIYTETDTMEPGAIRQTERATRGATASFKYKVTAADGKVLQNQTYVSKYIPIPDTFLYGPGADVPKPAEPAE